MNKEEEKIISEIQNDLNGSAQIILDQIAEEIKEMKEKQLKFFQIGLQKETDTYLERELSELRQYAKTKASQDSLKAKHELLHLRQQMTKDIFDRVNDNLVQFTKSDQYEAYLKENLQKVTFHQDTYIECRQDDVEMISKLVQQLFGVDSYTIKPKFFEIGGFHYVDLNNKYQFSCDLSEKLNEAKQWFYHHSGFDLVKEGSDE